MTKNIYTGIVVNLNVDTVTLPNGITVDLEVVRHPGAAAVVPLKDGTFLHYFFMGRFQYNRCCQMNTKSTLIHSINISFIHLKLTYIKILIRF